jgi:hypothetical protein
MFALLTQIDKLFNKKSKRKILRKITEILNIIILSESFFMLEQSNKNTKTYIKKLEIFQSIIENIFINNSGKIKIERSMLQLIEKYNKIHDQRKRKAIENENSDTECDEKSDT